MVKRGTWRALYQSGWLGECRKMKPHEELVADATTGGLEGMVYFDKVLRYFADLITEHNIKPWEKRGKRILLRAIRLIADPATDFESLITCQPCHKCRRGFYPIIDETLVDVFLEYYQGKVAHAELFVCEDCGGRLKQSKVDKEAPWPLPWAVAMSCPRI